MAGLKDRLIQFVLRGRDELSPAARQSADALEALRLEGTKLGQALDKTKEARGLAASLAEAGRAADQARTTLERAEQRAAALREALDQDPESQGLAVALLEAEKEAARASRALGRVTGELGELEQAAQAAGIDSRNLAQEQQRLAREVADGQQAVRLNADALRELEREQAAAARGAAEHASRLAAAREAMSAGARQVLGFAAAYVSLDAAIGLASRGIDAIRAGISNMLQAGDQAEALQARMTSLMGSIEAGEQAVEWIGDFAKRTPMATAEVADAFMLLKAYGLDPMDGSLQALVDKNEQLGGGMDRLEGIVTAVGQAWAKSKLQTEEILQLVERGVPAWDMLARVTGKNAAQLEKLASEGRLGRDVVAALIAELGKSADGAAEAGMSRLSGLMSQLADTAKAFYKEVAEAGALDYVKGRLQALIGTLDEMDRDGRLDKLAKSLSAAFIDGAKRVEAFAKALVGVDFKKLTDDSTGWLSTFGARLDQAAASVQMFIAPFRTLFNGITAGLSTVGLALTSFADMALSRFELIANAVPDLLGGDKLRTQIAEARTALGSMGEAFVKQIEQDSQDIRAAWEVTTQSAVDSAKEQTAAHKSAIEQQRMLDQAHADHLVANQKKVKEAAIAAAIEGTAAITDMANAMELIDTARTVQQVDGLRGALLSAYQDGKLSLEQYQQATGLLNGKLAELQKGAAGTASAISDLSEEFENLADVQQAIAGAQTDVDINKIKRALRELYEAGTITAAEYNQELQSVSARQKELKGTVEQTGRSGQQAGEQLTKSQEMYNAALEDSILTSEELRRISGQRMEEERRASGEAMARQRKGIDVAQRDMSAMEGFFGGVLSGARGAVANLSAQALEAFDRLRGISSVDMTIDTSGLEATRASLGRVGDALMNVKQAQLSVGMSGFGKWQLETQRASLETQQAYLSQKASLQSLMEGYDDGSISLESFIRRAEGLENGLGLLDDADLSGLKSALASARQEMEALGDASRSTLEDLQSELDQLRGNEAAVEERRFAQRRRELEAQRAEAQAAGNNQAVADMTRAIALLREVQAETAQQRFTQQVQAGQPQATPTVQQQPQQPTTVIRLETSRGQRVDVSVPQGQQTQLLDILAEAGLRSL